MRQHSPTPTCLNTGIVGACFGALAMIAWGTLNLSRTGSDRAQPPSVQPAYNMGPKVPLAVAAIDVPAGAVAANNP